VLPCYTLGRKGSHWRVLVPLRSDEALWIAFVIRPNLGVVGSTLDGFAVDVTTLSTSRDEAVLAADALVTADGRRPIDASQIAFASTRAATKRDHLRFRLMSAAGEVGDLAVVLAVPALYASVSGLPAPQPTSVDDAYGGWRLP
jgi:hypothetical protein